MACLVGHVDGVGVWGGWDVGMTKSTPLIRGSIQPASNHITTRLSREHSSHNAQRDGRCLFFHHHLHIVAVSAPHSTHLLLICF